MSHINLDIHDAAKLRIKSRPYMTDSDGQTMKYDYIELTITDKDGARTTIGLFGETNADLIDLSSNCRIAYQDGS